MTIEYDDLSEDARDRIIEDVKKELQPSANRRQVLQGGSVGLAALVSFFAGQNVNGANAAPNTDGTIGVGQVDLSDYEIVEDGSDIVFRDPNGNELRFGNQDLTVPGDLSVGGAVSADTATITNADGPTIGGDDLVGFPSTSTSVSHSIGDGWRTPNANRPVFLSTRLDARTDGTSRGDLRLEVDESGGTTTDYIAAIARVSNAESDGSQSRANAFALIPPGGSYQYNNQSDPKGINSVKDQREWVL